MNKAVYSETTSKGNNIKAYNVEGHYEFYVNGIFEVSCDINEFNETLEEVLKDNWIKGDIVLPLTVNQILRRKVKWKD